MELKNEEKLLNEEQEKKRKAVEKKRMAYAQRVWKKLTSKYTLEEIAESFIPPHGLSDAELEAANQELREFRRKYFEEMPREKRIEMKLWSLKYGLHDYLKTEDFIEEKSFGAVLKEYIQILEKDERDFAKDISISKARLSRLLTGQEEPNLNLAFRLEVHSADILNASFWWKLSMKRQGYLLDHDEKRKKEVQAQVKNALIFLQNKEKIDSENELV